MSDSKRNCQICPLCGKLYKGTDNLVEYNGEKMCHNCYGILEREIFPIEGIDPDGEKNPDYQEGYRQGASYMNRQWMRKIIQHYKKPIDTTTIEERANGYSIQKYGIAESFKSSITDSLIATRGYIEGAKEQKRIDIDMACRWLEENTDIDVEAFRKTMEA